MCVCSIVNGLFIVTAVYVCMAVAVFSDVNWWKGVSWRGEGLFPANFVTSDLTTEPAATGQYTPVDL